MAFDVFENFATDENLELEGAKLPLSSDAGLFVARANNDRYLRRMAEEYEKHKDILDKDTPEAEELDRKITLQVYAETILVGFYGKLTFKGKTLKYSVENAKKLLEIRDLRMKIVQFAQDRDNYLLKLEEEAAKK